MDNSLSDSCRKGVPIDAAGFEGGAAAESGHGRDKRRRAEGSGRGEECKRSGQEGEERANYGLVRSGVFVGSGWVKMVTW